MWEVQHRCRVRSFEGHSTVTLERPRPCGAELWIFLCTHSVRFVRAVKCVLSRGAAVLRYYQIIMLLLRLLTITSCVSIVLLIVLYLDVHCRCGYDAAWHLQNGRSVENVKKKIVISPSSTNTWRQNIDSSLRYLVSLSWWALPGTWN